MSAEVLRRAAAQARVEAEAHRPVAPNLTALYGDDCGSEARARRDDAVADWLDHTADTWRSRPVRERGAVFGGDQERALAVARAYLGESA